MLRKATQASRKRPAARALIAIAGRECNHEFFAIDAAVPVIAGYIKPDMKYDPQFGRLSLREGEGESEGLLKATVRGGANSSP